MSLNTGKLENVTRQQRCSGWCETVKCISPLFCSIICNSLLMMFGGKSSSVVVQQSSLNHWVWIKLPQCLRFDIKDGVSTSTCENCQGQGREGEKNYVASCIRKDDSNSWNVVLTLILYTYDYGLNCQTEKRDLYSPLFFWAHDSSEYVFLPPPTMKHVRQANFHCYEDETME